MVNNVVTKIEDTMRWFEINKDGGIQSMVEYGLKKYEEDKHITLKFECFYEAEAKQIHRLMKERPDVPYIVTHCTFKGIANGP